jgi:DnaJ-class molecular chaperone
MKDITVLTNILGIDYPFTKQELTKVYREKAFETHPDKGGDANKFIAIHDAYENLLEFCFEDDTGQYKQLRTSEGIPIEELGKGLGPTTNGVQCSKCKGKGYIEVTHTKYFNVGNICPVCDGSGVIRTIHRFGLFSGWRTCKRCQGMGYTKLDPVEFKSYHICDDCSGKGEKEIFNPVLQKGAVKYSAPNKKPERKKKQYCNCGAILKDGICWRGCNK